MSDYRGTPDSIDRGDRPHGGETIVELITRIAREMGVDPQLALAIAKQESGFDPNIPGDGGHSIGLFQLNDRGEGAGMSVAERQDPETNTRVALAVVKQVADEHPDWSPGQIAAAAQRPADRAGYARSVDAIYSSGDFSAGGGAAANGDSYNYDTSTGGNVVSGGAGDSGPPKYVDPTDFARDNYGFLAGYLDDPEIGPILKQAASEQWDLAKLEGALYKTDWWKNNSESMREWGALLNTDPATANQRITEFKSSLDTEAQKVGIQLKPEDLDWWAQHYLALGMSPDDPFIQKELVRVWNTRPDLRVANAGQIESIGSQLRATAAHYFRNLTQSDVDWWASQITTGAATSADFENVIRTQAAQRFSSIPNYEDLIMKGATPDQLFADRRDAIANTLEIDPSSLDFINDPRWSRVLGNPDNGGQPMTVNEALQYARSQPEFKGTVGANNTADQFDNAILKEFGAIAQ